jgi:UDPglucose 6-dehydrogenase
MNLGIVGQGFVGRAVYNTMKDFYNVETYDIQQQSTCITLEELVEKSDVIFLCLPTPMKRSGSCDLSIVYSVVNSIDDMGLEKVLVIKSTVPPGTTEGLNRKVSKKTQIVFNPEFLTEANYLDDFKNQTRIIIGGPRPASTKVKNLYKKVFQSTPIIKTGSTTAEMVKYFGNCFLATKVSFANEMKIYCDSIDIDYDKVVEYALYDQRIGDSHLQVPGPDGKSGFGGSCFPKDINALISEMRSKDISPMLLESVWKRNLIMRPEKDWENLKGRAVSEK